MAPYKIPPEVTADPNDPVVYEVPVGFYNKKEAFGLVTVPVPLTARFNIYTGSYDLYEGTPLVGSLTGRTIIATKNSNGVVEDYGNTELYNSLIQDGKISEVEKKIKPIVVGINKEIAPQDKQIQLADSKLYKSTANAAASGKATEPPKQGSDTSTSDDGEYSWTPDDKETAVKFLDNPTIKLRTQIREDFGVLVYPIQIATNGQDYLKFEILEYGIRKISPDGIGLTEKREVPKNSKVKGTICLPIQPSISDQNSVNWNELPMDIFDMAKQTAVITAGTQGATGIDKMITAVKQKLTNSEVSDAYGAIVATQLAKVAASSQNDLLSRMSGAILNPNMELLFQGPKLRPFTFNFRMTPRSKDEAFQVRSIIRAFKEASAVQQGIENLFLKAPYIFRIKYVLGGTNDDHPSINRIKECALTQVTVDYTPAATFMTYNDPEATMTSYAMSLTFSELEPVYAHEYKEIPTNHIGY